MLDPSSSEESGEEGREEEIRDAAPAVSPQRSVSAQGRDSRDGKRAGSARPRPASPVPGEKDKNEREKLQKEGAERRVILQIYVFVLRCIAYPFNAKQPTDMARRQPKVSRPQQLQQAVSSPLQKRWRCLNYFLFIWGDFPFYLHFCERTAKSTLL